MMVILQKKFHRLSTVSSPPLSVYVVVQISYPIFAIIGVTHLFLKAMCYKLFAYLQLCSFQ